MGDSLEIHLPLDFERALYGHFTEQESLSLLLLSWGLERFSSEEVLALSEDTPEGSCK